LEVKVFTPISHSSRYGERKTEAEMLPSRKDRNI
jgi:hypothetical protein